MVLGVVFYTTCLFKIIEYFSLMELELATGSKTTKVRRSLSLTTINILLILCLGFIGFYTVQKMRNTKHESETLTAIPAAPVMAVTDSEITSPPISDYQTIWKRNLFNTSKENDPASKKKIAPEKLDLAGKDLGLELVGTVLADDPKISLAVIDNLKTKIQDGYREGDRAGDVLIKKVLRKEVIITTEQGDMLLSLERKRSFEDVKTSRVSKLSVSRTVSIRLSREEVQELPADIEQLLQQGLISPYMFKDKTYGFRIDKIPPLSVLSEMGLKSEDIILGVNGKAAIDPKQAADYFRTFDKTGEASIAIMRRRRSRIIHYNIE